MNVIKHGICLTLIDLFINEKGVIFLSLLCFVSFLKFIDFFAIKKWLTGFTQSQSITCLVRAQKVYLEKQDPQSLIEIYQGAIDTSQPEESYKFVLLLALLHLEHNQAEKAKKILEANQTDNELLGTLLLAQANKPTNNGSNFDTKLDLIRDAVFQLTTSQKAS